MAFNSYINRSLVNSYSTRLEAMNIFVDKEALQKHFENMNQSEINSFMTNLLLSNNEIITQKLNSLNIKTVDKTNVDQKDLNEKIVKKLNLSNLTEFDVEQKNYLKFKNKDGKIFLTRNFEKDTKKIFLNILNDTSITNESDGKSNAENIFDYLKKKKLIETPLINTNEMEKNNPTKLESTIINELKKYYPNKNISYNTLNGLYIVNGDKNEDDIVLHVVNENNKLEIKIVNQKGYIKEDFNEKNDKAKIDVSNENISLENISIVLENDTEIERIINDTENEVDTIDKVQAHINRKYAEFRNIAGLSLVISNLIEKLKKNNSNSKGKQYVLKLPTNISNINDDAA